MTENQETKSLSMDQSLQIIFNLRDQFMSVIKYCPREFVESQYFTTIFTQLFQIYDKLEEPQELIDKIAIFGQIDNLKESHLTASVQWDI